MKKGVKKIDCDSEVTWQKIADEIGLSRQGAKHVYDSAIRKLQKDKRLKQYWIDLVINGEIKS